MSNTAPAPESVATPARVATKRTILMCKPDFYTVSYRINPWMHPEEPTDTSKAVEQWESLVAVYEQLGFDISYIDPIDGLPDMVYAANGGFVLDGIAYGAKFQYPERQPEGPAYMDWFRQAGLTVAEPEQTNEGEGDFLLIGDTIFAGTGFRSDSTSHDELAKIYGREVVTLKLINPSFYHLDTAIAVLDPEPVDGVHNIAYLESAFDEPSLAVIARVGGGVPTMNVDAPGAADTSAPA
jgi:N-dimethylarginine dimethylaminohydrolase